MYPWFQLNTYVILWCFDYIQQPSTPIRVLFSLKQIHPTWLEPVSHSSEPCVLTISETLVRVTSGVFVSNLFIVMSCQYINKTFDYKYYVDSMRTKVKSITNFNSSLWYTHTFTLKQTMEVLHPMYSLTFSDSWLVFGNVHTYLVIK